MNSTRTARITTTALMAAAIALPIAVAGPAAADTVFIGGTGQSWTEPMAPANVVKFTAPFSTDPGDAVVQVLYPSLPWDRPEASAPLAERAIIAADYQTAAPVTAVGLSKGSQVLHEVQRQQLAPTGTQFVYIGDPNSPTGWQAQFGLHRPDANTYDTTVVYGEYDGFADWPDRFNLLAAANAVAGIAYVHTQYGNGTAADPLTRLDEAEVTVETNPNGTTTTTKLVPTRDLPLTRPIRDTLKTFKLGTDGLDAFDRELRKHIDRGYSRNDKKGDQGNDVDDRVVARNDAPTGTSTTTAQRTGLNAPRQSGGSAGETDSEVKTSKADRANNDSSDSGDE